MSIFEMLSGFTDEKSAKPVEIHAELLRDALKALKEQYQ